MTPLKSLDYAVLINNVYSLRVNRKQHGLLYV